MKVLLSYRRTPIHLTFVADSGLFIPAFPDVLSDADKTEDDGDCLSDASDSEEEVELGYAEKARLRSEGIMKFPQSVLKGKFLMKKRISENKFLWTT